LIPATTYEYIIGNHRSDFKELAQPYILCHRARCGERRGFKDVDAAAGEKLGVRGKGRGG
jgi:hypothetical protein